jgi:outer membrane lipoprotein-sorting protein
LRKTLLIALLFLIAAAPVDPWERLAALRARLADQGARSAEFTQTYRPAGFGAGESERGRFSVSLPDCLRWDYTDPEPKSFLLCGGDVYSWIPGETGGRHGRFDPRREAGLDLMLLAVDELRGRYRAMGSGREIVLEPSSREAALRTATLVLDEDGGGLSAIRYTDLDGNETRFELRDWKAGATPAAFEPPAGIRWSED